MSSLDQAFSHQQRINAVAALDHAPGKLHFDAIDHCLPHGGDRIGLTTTLTDWPFRKMSMDS